MLTQLLNAAIGPGFEMGAIIALIGLAWDRVESALERRRKAKDELLRDLLEEAVCMTARDTKAAPLEKENDVDYKTGEHLLLSAAETAIELGKARGVNLEKNLGGKAGVAAATQVAFKKVKTALRRN